MGDLSEHFSRHEFACNCGCGYDTVDSDTLTTLEIIHDYFQAPITINSGCRCNDWNNQCGGSVGSLHMQARAADIVVEGIASWEVADFAETVLQGRGGVGRYDTFTHVDTRSNGPARWSG